MIKTDHLRGLSRRFWGFTFTLVIAVAVCVQLGRQAFPLLNDYRKEISDYLGDQLGVVIEVGAIEATWSGLRPKLSLRDVEIFSHQGDTIFAINDATAELSLLNSLYEWRLAWRQMSFDGFRTRFEQMEDGGWQISGLPAQDNPQADSDGFLIDDPYDVFVFGRRIHIADAEFTLRYASGDETQLQIPSISLDNDKNFHRINASIDMDDGRRTFSLIIEGDGDPRSSDFFASGFLELNDFPSQRLVDALALSSLNVDSENHLVNLRLWFTGDADKGLSLEGELTASGNLHVDGKSFDLPEHLSATFTGRMRPERGWYLTMQGVQAEWSDLSSPPADVRIYGDFRRINGLRFKKLDLARWWQIIKRTGIANERASDIVRQLKPRGTLSNLDVAFTDKASGYFRATANVDNAAVEAFRGAPSVDNARGFLSVSATSGRIDLHVDDTLTLGLPKVYHDPLVFEEAYGQIGWQVDFENKMTYVTSGLLRVVNPEEKGFGYLSLSLPFTKEFGEQHMTLAIGVPETLAINHKKYVPKTIPDELYAWLDRSVQGGVVHDAKFLFHGSVEKRPEVQPTVQLHGVVKNASLLPDPQWPEVTAIDGTMTVDNMRLDIHLDKARMAGNRISNAKVNIVSNPGGPGNALAIHAKASGTTDSAMSLINNSPLSAQIGDTFSGWGLAGNVGADVKLIFPLDTRNPGMYQKVDITLGNAQMAVPEIDLAINKIRGKFHYETGRGIYTDRLQGKLFDRSFTTVIRSDVGDDGNFDTRVGFSGIASVDDLYAWTKRPELKLMTGESAVTGELFIPSAHTGAPFELNIESSLQGVAVELPAPLGKKIEDEARFSTRLRRYESGDEYRFQLDDRLRLSLLTTPAGRVSAFAEINNLTKADDDLKPIADTGRFELAGNLRRFDLDQWIAVRDRYFEFVEEGQDDMPVNLSLFIETLALGDFEIENLRVDGERQPDSWLLALSSELLAGSLLVPESEDPLILDLDYLRFGSMSTESDDLAESESALAGFDLSRAVSVDFATRELSLGEQNFGEWRFKLRPIPDGVVVHNIRSDVRGLSIGDEESGAEFIWLQNENGQSSQFTGSINASDLGKVFSAWGQEQVLQSEQARFDIDARWPGAPDEVALGTVEGLISLDVRNGSFNRGAGSDENGLLRLVALFNFDTLLRRLRLDFSDLAAKGYAFDRIEGNLDFQDGTIFLTEPLLVEASSSRLQLAGTVDVVNERVDGDMVATLPVGGNATLATALVAGLPAALGVYLFSKIFKKQIDQVSSLNIGVQGEWEDPKIKIKRVFDIDAANRRGKELRDEKNAGEGEAPMTAPETAELL